MEGDDDKTTTKLAPAAVNKRAYDSDFDSFIWCYSGPRGSGKTLRMVAECYRVLLLGYPAWSNIRIWAEHKGRHYETKPITPQALMVFEKELAHGFVFIDEVQSWLGSRRGMTIGSQLMSSAVAMIRKRSIAILYTAKYLKLVDSRLQWETDGESVMIDLYHSEDACEERARGVEKLKRGTWFCSRNRDISGYFTGRPYRETGFEHLEYFNGSLYWENYDTSEEPDYLAGMGKVKLQLPVTEISLQGGDGQSSPVDLGEYQPVVPHAEVERLGQLVASLRGAGATEIRTKEFWKLAEQNNIGNPYHLGRYLEQFGVSKKAARGGDKYLLPLEPGPGKGVPDG